MPKPILFIFFFNYAYKNQNPSLIFKLEDTGGTRVEPKAYWLLNYCSSTPEPVAQLEEQQSRKIMSQVCFLAGQYAES